jgi:hypothetical protein
MNFLNPTPVQLNKLHQEASLKVSVYSDLLLVVVIKLCASLRDCISGATDHSQGVVSAASGKSEKNLEDLAPLICG